MSTKVWLFDATTMKWVSFAADPSVELRSVPDLNKVKSDLKHAVREAATVYRDGLLRNIHFLAQGAAEKIKSMSSDERMMLLSLEPSSSYLKGKFIDELVTRAETLIEDRGDCSLISIIHSMDDALYDYVLDEDTGEYRNEIEEDFSVIKDNLLGLVTGFSSGSEPESDDVLEEQKKKYEELTQQLKRIPSLRATVLLDAIINREPPPTELLLLAEEPPDSDLQNVMSYRKSKAGDGLIVLGLSEYVEAIRAAQSLGLIDALHSVTTLGILHHSGRSLVDDPALSGDLRDALPTIAHSLPNCTKVVERGCGMADVGKSKELAIRAAQRQLVEGEGRLEKEAVKTALKTGRVHFSKASKSAKDETIREHTLEVTYDEGSNASTPLMKTIIAGLQRGELGRDTDHKLKIKFYVAGYNGNPTEGAIPDRDDRYLSAPKAIQMPLDPAAIRQRYTDGLGNISASSGAGSASDEILPPTGGKKR